MFFVTALFAQTCPDLLYCAARVEILTWLSQNMYIVILGARRQQCDLLRWSYVTPECVLYKLLQGFELSKYARTNSVLPRICRPDEYCTDAYCTYFLFCRYLNSVLNWSFSSVQNLRRLTILFPLAYIRVVRSFQNWGQQRLQWLHFQIVIYIVYSWYLTVYIFEVWYSYDIMLVLFWVPGLIVDDCDLISHQLFAQCS